MCFVCTQKHNVQKLRSPVKSNKYSFENSHYYCKENCSTKQYADIVLRSSKRLISATLTVTSNKQTKLLETDWTIWWSDGMSQNCSPLMAELRIVSWWHSYRSRQIVQWLLAECNRSQRYTSSHSSTRHWPHRTTEPQSRHSDKMPLLTVSRNNMQSQQNTDWLGNITSSQIHVLNNTSAQ